MERLISLARALLRLLEVLKAILEAVVGMKNAPEGTFTETDGNDGGSGD